jgi:hypothetical protein
MPASAQMQERARLVGGGDRQGGRCTVEVVVDGAANVEIRGDVANLRDVSGRPPQFRRFECTSIMPPNPADFRFRGIDGRGRQTLIRDPRSGGAAVVRIEDPAGGAEGYTFEIMWSNGAGGPYAPGPGGYGERDRYNQVFDSDRAVRECQGAVRREAADRYRARNVEFRDARVDNDRDWVRGRVDVIRGDGREDRYEYACALNRETGQIQSVRFNALQGGNSYPGAVAPESGRGMQNCQTAVAQRLRNDGYGRLEFGRMNVDDRPGRADWIVGDVKGMRGNGSDFFNFACSVELRDGDVRSVEVTRR